jgi:hypothetical protein
MEQEILMGDVLLPSSVVPKDSLKIPEGIQGYTLWPDTSLAPFTWVYAQAYGHPEINAWVHTTWSIGWYYYVHNEPSSYHPISYGHSYYIKGLHWLPRNTRDFPQPCSNPFPPPSWAQGVVFSPTYYTVKKYDRPERGGELQIELDVFLTGPSICW